MQIKEINQTSQLQIMDSQLSLILKVWVIVNNSLEKIGEDMVPWVEWGAWAAWEAPEVKCQIWPKCNK